MAEILRIDVGREPFKLGGSDIEQLQRLQEAVGGYIEVFILSDRTYLVVNEDGPMQNLPLNPLATGIAGRTILGNAVLLSAEEGERHLR